MHIYFSGVGGVGIGPLAMLALDSGFDVSGSDLQHTEMVSYLRDRGVRVYIGQDGTQIADEHIARPIDWFVYSSALPEDHPELIFARQHGLKMSKRAEFLNFILSEKQLRLIAVAGTHGKTTTTGMIVWALKQLGIPVSYSIGTSISFGPPAQYAASSEYFVYECDEFDRNFLEFQPYRSLITSYDYDHPDTYSTPDDYKYAFLDFIEQSQFVYAWEETADELGISGSPTRKRLAKSDPGIASVTLPGAHVRQNAWLAARCLDDLLPHVTIDAIVAAINTFPGTSRRFEKLADDLYTDYAHHPAEITATLQMAKELSPNVAVIYQPHQNIRQHEILKSGGYQDSFKGATNVYWLPTYLSREYQNLEVISAQTLIDSNTDPSRLQHAEMDDHLWQIIQTHRQNGDLVLAMSAGDLDPWLRQKITG